MKNVFILGLGFMLGSALTYQFSLISPANAAKNTSAFLIVSVHEPEPEKMKPYHDKAGPLGKEKGGVETVAFAAREQVEVLEGNWDYPGILLIEKFASMQILKDYWFSDEYQEVKKLREGLADVNFIVALEAVK